MRHGIRAAACLAAITLAACSGGGDDRARTVEGLTETETTATTAPATADDDTTSPEEEPAASGDLDDLVLTLDDMPSGWTTAPELSEGDDDDTAGSDTSFCGVDDAELDIDDEATRSAEAAFKESDFGPFVLHAIGEVPDPAVAEQALDTMLDAASQCEEWTETDDEGAEITYSISPLSFDNVGDDTIAFRMSADTEMMPLTIDMVMWKQGSYLSLVSVFGVGGGSDADLLTELVEEAAGRL